MPTDDPVTITYRVLIVAECEGHVVTERVTFQAREDDPDLAKVVASHAVILLKAIADTTHRLGNPQDAA